MMVNNVEVDVNSDVLTELVQQLIAQGASFKKVSGNFVNKDEVEKFIKTLSTISSVGPFDSTITAGGVCYPLEAYQIDTKIAAAFVQPRAVKMPGPIPFTYDVSVHYKYSEIMDPAEILDFQHRFLNQFKVQPTLVPVTDSIKPVLLGEIVNCFNGEKFHAEDLAAVKSIPVELKIASDLYSQEYFQYSIESIVKFVVVNFYSNLK